jgi:hypothetical protein
VGDLIGLILGLIAGVTTVLTTRPSKWRRDELRQQFSSRWPGAMVYGLICAVSFELGWGIRYGFTPRGSLGELAVLGGLAIGIVAGLNHGLKDHRALRWIDTLVVGLLGGFGSGVLSWVIGGLLLNGLSIGFVDWVFVWFLGGLGLGGTAGIVAGLRRMRREPTTPAAMLPGLRGEGWPEFVLRLHRVFLRGGRAALVVGAPLGALAGIGLDWMILPIGNEAAFVGRGLFMTLGVLLLCILSGGGTGLWAGVFGVLWGGLRGGLTGPEIVRRTAPNQGIRQSAVNIGVFALAGGITIGIVMWILNGASFVLLTGSVPQADDWWKFGMNNVLFFGVLSGLVPGAACIQHYTLRFMLWCSGVIPWRYARFLDYATDRKFLQRVGGHYRFLHHLLRDHLAAMPHHTH